ncbi:MAG: Na/Pi symporter, partial [bacterium]|nr:Na/Pi symporter [bacterium]
MKPKVVALLKILAVFLLLFAFLNSVSLLGAAFKLLGKQWVEVIVTTTNNPLVALLVGVLATTIVQSSSVSTSMVVGLVSAGAMSIDNAVPVIMGANIGTTVTNTVVSMGHISRKEEFQRAFAGATVHDFFNFLAVAVFLPLELATGFLQKTATYLSTYFYGAGSMTYKSPVKAALKPFSNALKHFLVEDLSLTKQWAGVIILVVALILIFTCLFLIVKIMRSLMLSKIERTMQRFLELSGVMTISIGAILTVLVQSSSITTSLFVPLVGAGLITVANVFPLTLGANIGTTVTALLAALAGNQAGLTIAFVHLLFNLCGTVMVYPIPKLRRIPIRLAE